MPPSNSTPRKSTWLPLKLAPENLTSPPENLAPEMMLRAAMRSRIIDVDPSDGVRLPKSRNGKRSVPMTREEVFGRIMPAIDTVDGRIPVWLAAGAGLRRDDCVGLPWGAVDLDQDVLHVAQVAVETSKKVVLRPYPKPAAGVRSVPITTGLSAILREYREMRGDTSDKDLVVTNRTGKPMWRTNFRTRVWRPALVRAGLIGSLVESAAGVWHAAWTDATEAERHAEFATETAAVECVALRYVGGPRFHDLRHSYATWLVSDGVAVNNAQKATGHSLASTTLDLLHAHPGALRGSSGC
ncbi:MAG TPA: tyrosine-type recombinase/integrase [Actinocatenispora sp.]